jgi:PPOX class probable F420-dependent enzyme
MILNEHVRQFLSQPHFAAIATINADGTPQQTVIWYELEGDEIVMNTAAGRVKEVNLRRDSRVSICVVDGYAYVTITGRARLIDDQPTAQADIRRLAIRYHGAEQGNRMAEEQFSQQRRVTLRVPIEHVITYNSA